MEVTAPPTPRNIVDWLTQKGYTVLHDPHSNTYRFTWKIVCPITITDLRFETAAGAANLLRMHADSALRDALERKLAELRQ